MDTHAGKGKNFCSICNKEYSRSDVLSRHMVQVHGSVRPAIGRPRKVSCEACLLDRTACVGIPPNTCTRCIDLGRICRYSPRSNSQKSRSASPRSRQGNLTPSGVAESSIDQSPSFGHHANIPSLSSHPSTLDIPIDNSNTSIVPDLHLASADCQNVFSWTSMFDFIPSTNQPVAWGLGETQGGDIFSIFGVDAPVTPALSFLDGHSQPFLQAQEREERTSMRGENWQSPESLYGPPSEIPDGQPYDSVWPHIDKPRTPDAHVNLPLPTTHRSLLPYPTSMPRISQQTIGAMLTIILQSHQSVWSMVDTTNFPSSQILTSCINLYHRHFHDWLTVTENPMEELQHGNPLVLMAMASIGAMYSRDRLQRLGIALSELVRRAILYIRENDRRFLYETPIIRAYLLQTHFGFFCGSHKAFQQSESAVGGLIMACKRMHLLRPGLSAVQALKDSQSAPSQEDLDRAKREDRRRGKLGWGIYLLDCQLILLNLSHQLMLTDLNTAFPSNAPLKDDLGPTMSFHEVLDSVLRDGVPPIPLDDLGYCVLAYTLYRLCTDASKIELQSTQDVVVFDKYRLSFPLSIKHHPQLVLDQIAAHTLDLSSPPSPRLIAVSALAYHSHLQFTIPGWIELIRGSAGKAGTISGRTASRSALERAINKNVQSARNILLHAGMLSCLVARYTFDTPTEVIWAFDAALTIWAINKFCSLPISSPSTGQGIIISWSHCSEYDQWALRGGSISIQGLGDVYALTEGKILDHFMGKLEGLSWGVAEQYRMVLYNLTREMS